MQSLLDRERADDMRESNETEAQIIGLIKEYC